MVRFSELNKRIIILKCDEEMENQMGETSPIWTPFFAPKYLSDFTATDLKNFTTNELLFFEVLKNFNSYVVSGEPFIKDISDDTYDYAVKKYGVWSKVNQTSSKEFSEAEKLRDESLFTIKIRFLKGIRTDMKILFEKRILNIVSVVNLYSKNEQLEITCREVDVNGK